MTIPKYTKVGPTIWIARQTKLITDSQASKMVAACDRQITEHVAPSWAMLPSQVKLLASGTKKIPAGDYALILSDQSEAGSLGYHEELPGDIVTGVIGVGTVLDNNGTMFDGELSVSAVLSHEICETFVNPHTSGWSDSGKGWLVATELCDPVQGDAYTIDGVSVSDFVTPDFFSPVVTRGDQYDWMGVLRKPFSIAKGGYVLNYEGGEINTYYGAVPPPEWLMKMKQHGESRSRRLKDHRPM